jgi:cell pole-organizing protein PopZ
MTVAELLRPMLREWLDANLPRIVQQVLREELGKSPLPGKDGSGG